MTYKGDTILMAIHEIEEASLLEKINSSNGKLAVFIYTPFCGTCSVGERMLEIADLTGVSVPLYKLNINYAPKLREDWQISSVPCIALIDNGQPILKEYVMRSVDHIYKLLTP